MKGAVVDKEKSPQDTATSCGGSPVESPICSCTFSRVFGEGTLHCVGDGGILQRLRVPRGAII